MATAAVARPRPQLRPPLQARSIASYERLLEAARATLDEKSFDEATVAEIAERAGLTVGAFYARFADKEALLGHLEQLLFDDMRAAVSRIAATARERPPAALVRELVAALAALYRANRAVARALVMRSHVDPALNDRLRELNRENIGKIVAALAASGEVRHPDPRRALEFAFYGQRSILREAVVFGEGWAKERRWSDPRIVEETTRMLVAYLGLAETGA
jgi:AcrR family transcriptional regulator